MNQKQASETRQLCLNLENKEKENKDEPLLKITQSKENITIINFNHHRLMKFKLETTNYVRRHHIIIDR